jgi:diadenosine tetraphosphate (Ap4A) HIT family hydrolase
MGNEVPHAHIHLIPRYENDSVSPVLHNLPHLKLSDEELKIIADKINK